MSNFSLKIEQLKPEKLTPYIGNARTHSEEQIGQIACFIVEFGFVNPILVGESDMIIAGNGRLLAAQKLGLEHVPVIRLDQLANMVFTDPPYNVNYANSAKDKMRGTNRPIKNDNLGEDFQGFLHDSCLNMLKVTKGALYICMSSSELHTLHQAFTQAGGRWSTFIIWAKNHFTMGRADYQRQYEPMLYGWKQGNDHFWCGARNQGDIWFINRPVANKLHPTMKPVELVERAILNSSKTKDIVLDTFGGSGTTMIACEKTNRHARLIELDPIYVDVIVQRWQEFSGKEATLLATGEVFTKK